MTIEIKHGRMTHRISNHPAEDELLKRLGEQFDESHKREGRAFIKRLKRSQKNAHRQCPKCKCCSMLYGTCLGCCREVGEERRANV